MPLQPLDRFGFYATCREPDLAVRVATGDDRFYANILLDRRLHPTESLIVAGI